jgi:tRNA-dihydrouridine synthase B
LKIGDINIRDYPLFLAPMEDITDPSFRMVCKMHGADFMYTEFISSDGLIRDGWKSVKKLDIYDYERPIGIQLYGHLTEAMVEAAHMAEEAGPEIIDINFGCPVKKIANRGAGAGMLRNIPLMIEMTGAIVKAVKLPVTVKTRLGWDEDSKNIMEVAERLQDVGIKTLTIHGRTRAQLYKGVADWTLIGEVKNNPRITIPVIGNGDIDSPVKAKEMFDRYGVDGIMIGRATVGRPWIFKEIRHYLDNGDLLPEPTVSEKVDIALFHLEKSLEHKEGMRSIFEMRRHLSNYFKGLPHFRETRLKLLTTPEADGIKVILNEIRQKWGEFRTDDRTSVYTG